MKRRQFITLLGGAASWPYIARAQPSKTPIVGFLGASTPAAAGQRVAAFVQRLRELGWTEGRTVAIEYRWAEGAVHMNCRGRVREMEIREAAMEDAAGACEVMRRSIAELCVADHRGDVDVLARWLSNKTPDTFRSWIAHQGNSVLVAVEQDVILGVGAVTETGEITLNYVSPDARFRGVSRALLGALEGRAMKQGNVRCTLTSTETARRFYRANGYVEDRLPAEEFSTSGCPMSKVLTLGNS